MSGGTTYAGTITLGDQDIWSFTACTGDSINLQLNTTNFDGQWKISLGRTVAPVGEIPTIRQPIEHMPSRKIICAPRRAR